MTYTEKQLNKLFWGIAIDLQEAIKDKLIELGIKYTGAALSSVKVVVDGNKLVITMNDYLEYIEYGCFFNKNVLINTSKGLKKLKKLKIGDLVWEGNSYKKLINKMMYNIVKKITKIKIYVDDKTLEVTEEHPIYTKNGWKIAKDLKKGDEVYCIW